MTLKSFMNPVFTIFNMTLKSCMNPVVEAVKSFKNIKLLEMNGTHALKNEWFLWPNQKQNDMLSFIFFIVVCDLYHYWYYFINKHCYKHHMYPHLELNYDLKWSNQIIGYMCHWKPILLFDLMFRTFFDD